MFIYWNRRPWRRSTSQRPHSRQAGRKTALEVRCPSSVSRPPSELSSTTPPRRRQPPHRRRLLALLPTNSRTERHQLLSEPAFHNLLEKNVFLSLAIFFLSLLYWPPISRFPIVLFVSLFFPSSYPSCIVIGCHFCGSTITPEGFGIFFVFWVILGGQETNKNSTWVKKAGQNNGCRVDRRKHIYTHTHTYTESVK